MENIKEKTIALLIDADNVKADLIKNILAEAGKYGKVSIRRIYGNWTDSRLGGWKTQINTFALRPIQKFSIAKGKNSTDTAMIIDAMDILYSKNVSGFCIASSDSDYTGLAQRIREDGIFVLGIGEANITSEAFVNACDSFVFTENLNSFNEEKVEKKIEEVLPKSQKKSVKIDLPINKITNTPIDVNNILKAFDMVVGDNGLAYMGEIGAALRKLDPSFDCRTYSSASMTNLFKRLPNIFDLVYSEDGSSLFLKLNNPRA